jgi:hypothetical protein
MLVVNVVAIINVMGGDKWHLFIILAFFVLLALADWLF